MTTSPSTVAPASSMTRRTALVIALCWAIVVFDGYDLIVYGTTIPSLLAEPGWHLTPETAGTIGSLAFVGMLVGALTAGNLADRLGRRRTVIGCLAWFTLFTALCGVATSPETFAALRVEVNSWRWQGVPFYIRAGKLLPVTCTEVVARLRRPPVVFSTCTPVPNYFRFRISPEVTAAFGLTVMDSEDKMIGQQVELLASHHPGANEMDAYERVLGDALAGDATLFAREDYIEEAWRIVDPVLKADTPVHEYEPGTWGPSQVDRSVAPPRGWHNPTMAAQQR